MPEEHSHTGNWLRRITGSLTGEPRDLDDLNEVLGHARERGIIDTDAHEMLEGVLRVVELQVRDIMVPRSQMAIVNRDDPPEEILPMVVESGHSRFPVIGDDRDQIVGILLAKDLLRYFTEGGRANFDIKECLRPAVFIPESKRLNVLLKEFRVSHHHIAIVVDEYGGVSGLVTIEDVLEEIVGEIDDEYDPETVAEIQRIDDHACEAVGRAHIDEINAAMNLELPEDGDYDTIGGLVFSELGRIPQAGEAVVWQDKVRISVLEATKRRVDRVRIERLENGQRESA
jgi:magnesium and cobalt transporter